MESDARTHRRLCKAPVTSHLGHSRCSLTARCVPSPSYHSVVNVHRCMAAPFKTANKPRPQCSWPTRVHRVQHSRLMHKIYFGVPRPSPRGRFGGDAASARPSAIKKSGRDLDLQSKEPRGHGHVGMSGNLVFQDEHRRKPTFACSRFKSPD
jgi:hypothetical protein